MIGLFTLFFLAAFVVAQGAVVFVTAYLGLRGIGNSHWLAKLAAMSLSYLAWIIFTVGGYSLAGGDGSFMKGFAVVLGLCFTALVSSLGFLLVWLVWPKVAGLGRSTSAAAA
jgi:hypothetical protein